MSTSRFDFSNIKDAMKSVDKLIANLNNESRQEELSGHLAYIATHDERALTKQLNRLEGYDLKSAANHEYQDADGNNRKIAYSYQPEIIEINGRDQQTTLLHLKREGAAVVKVELENPAYLEQLSSIQQVFGTPELQAYLRAHDDWQLFVLGQLLEIPSAKFSKRAIENMSVLLEREKGNEYSVLTEFNKVVDAANSEANKLRKA